MDSKEKLVKDLNKLLKIVEINYKDFNPKIYLTEDQIKEIEKLEEVTVGEEEDGRLFISPKTFITTITKYLTGTRLAYVCNEEDRIEEVKFLIK